MNSHVVVNTLPIDVTIDDPNGSITFNKSSTTNALLRNGIFRTYCTYEGNRYYLSNIEITSYPNIVLGNFTYDYIGDLNTLTVHTDVSSVRFMNYLPFPVSVHYRGNKVALIPPMDPLNFSPSTSYQSGDSGITLFDNNGEGMILGDMFIFTVLGKKWYTFTISDNHTRNIHVGINTCGEKLQSPTDVYSYSWGGYTGFTYYVPLKNTKGTYQTSYRTQRTNENAPY